MIVAPTLAPTIMLKERDRDKKPAFIILERRAIAAVLLWVKDERITPTMKGKNFLHSREVIKLLTRLSKTSLSPSPKTFIP